MITSTVDNNAITGTVDNITQPNTFSSLGNDVIFSNNQNSRNYICQPNKSNYNDSVGGSDNQIEIDCSFKQLNGRFDETLSLLNSFEIFKRDEEYIRFLERSAVDTLISLSRSINRTISKKTTRKPLNLSFRRTERDNRNEKYRHEQNKCDICNYIKYDNTVVTHEHDSHFIYKSSERRFVSHGRRSTRVKRSTERLLNDKRLDDDNNHNNSNTHIGDERNIRKIYTSTSSNSASSSTSDTRCCTRRHTVKLLKKNSILRDKFDCLRGNKLLGFCVEPYNNNSNNRNNNNIDNSNERGIIDRRNNRTYNTNVNNDTNNEPNNDDHWKQCDPRFERSVTKTLHQLGCLSRVFHNIAMNHHRTVR